MKRYLPIVVIILILFQWAWPVQAKSNETVLVIYNVSKGEHTNDVQEIIYDVIMKGASCSSISLSEYKPSLISLYSCIIIANFTDEDIPEILNNDLLNYKGKVLRLGKNEADTSGTGYKGRELQRTELSHMLGLKNEKIGLYIKLDYIYPISDFNLVSDMAEYLKEKQIPFVFVIIPFYKNMESRAAKNYGKLLKYLMDCGGTPIIHCPVFTQMSENDMPLPNEVLEKLETAIGNLASFDIFPIAIEMPEAYLRRTDYGQVFHCFSHYFAVEGTGVDVYTVSADTPFPILKNELTKYIELNQAVYEVRPPDNIYELDKFFTEVSFLASSKYNHYAVSLPSWMDLEQFKSIINGLKSKNINFLNFSYGTQSVRLGMHNIENKNGMLTYNGTLNVTSASHKATDDSPKNELVVEVETFLRQGNLVVIVFSLIAIMVLMLAFSASKYMDRKKFLVKRR